MCSKDFRKRTRNAAWIIGCFISLFLLLEKEGAAFEIVEATPIASVRADMRMPTDAAFGREGSLYVLDGYQGRIVVRSPAGRVRSFVPEAPCGLNRPLGITVHGKSIYVANTGNRRITELGLGGECIRNVSLPDRDEQAPFVPTDLAIEGGSVVVADRGENRLHMCVYPAFDLDRSVGQWAGKAGALNAPYLIDMKAGRVWVTDVMNGRLVLLTVGGQFVRDLGERGVREGQFIRPKGVAVRPGSSVFVSDSALGVVQVFDEELRYLGTIGSRGRPHAFEHPAGLAAFDDLLAVVEQGSDTATLMRVHIPSGESH